MSPFKGFPTDSTRASRAAFGRVAVDALVGIERLVRLLLTFYIPLLKTNLLNVLFLPSIAKLNAI